MNRLTLCRVWALLLAFVLVFPALTAMDDEARLRDLQSGNAPANVHRSHAEAPAISFEELEQGPVAAPFSLFLEFCFVLLVVLPSSRPISVAWCSASCRAPPSFA